MLIQVKKVDNYDYKKTIYYSDLNNTTKTERNRERYRERNREKSLEKGRRYHEENKERLQK